MVDELQNAKQSRDLVCDQSIQSQASVSRRKGWRYISGRGARMMRRGSWVVGCFVFGALGQLDALACMTEYAQARPTLSTTSAPPRFGQGGSAKVGKKETGVSEMGGVEAAGQASGAWEGGWTRPPPESRLQVGEKMRSPSLALGTERRSSSQPLPLTATLAAPRHA